jgi:hypothetical protein
VIAGVRLLDPVLLLESDSELVGDFTGGLLGSALNLTATALFPIDFHSAADNQSRRVGPAWSAGRLATPRFFLASYTRIRTTIKAVRPGQLATRQAR